jgi:SAM-dependent methyltransferase
MDDLKIKAHYQGLFEKEGVSPKSIQWPDRGSQIKRFKILTGIDRDLQSVLDVGCGLGDLGVFLRENEFTGDYVGADIVPEFIDFADKKFAGDDKSTFRLLEPNVADLPTGCDHSIVSGLFNNYRSDSSAFMKRLLGEIFEVSNRGMAFNALSTYVDYKESHLSYADPMEVFDFCKRTLGGFPVLKHDYLLKKGGYPYEFTIFLYKKPGL